ncbi:multidrug efflux pump subunit AcrB [Parabacteroides sp. PFB2-12]|uniref:efflux RND transporter permease subunit n=1 Tax=unclassified Parabacteroides TaxID=2649774 RepID=UPI00247514A4|nr:MULTISPECIES: efflux RND transporter permease subunit [unclassified Parabacteroides]MDH6343631.1 multidrug efflux pump subunit AcrB [Parabacteroides sp. PM6-13]MDH6391388.1 multidrug efflux pump subunit AcrB [Parabacteroides sp. PFB2-12]
MDKKKQPISSFTIIVAFVCIALAGIAFVPLLPIKLSPSRVLPQLTVSYNFPNNSARVIEMEVTSRLEAMLARIKGIRNINSTSGNGWGYITLELDKHTDIDAARFEASTIVRQTWPSLPDGLSYPVLEMRRPDENDSRPFISYTLNAAATPIFIQRFAEEQIKPRLASIPGIYRVDVSGATPMEWRLEYDSRQLTEVGVSLNDIQQAISQYYQKEFLGIALTEGSESSEEWIRLALVPEYSDNGFDATRITLTSQTGQLIRLDQLVKVTRQEEAPRNYFRINGLNSIYLSIRADDMANQLDLAKKVKAEMDHIRTILPAGYEVHTSYDATEYIQKELDKIYLRSGLTLLILLLFVLLITRNFKYLLLIAISIAVNLGIAVILYYLLKLEIQLYSLAGITISLSLIIDNTIVMTDHIRNRHDRGAFLAILAATLTTMGALCMIFFLDERLRLNLQDFAAVVIINLGVSLFIALFLVPALIDKMGLLRKKKKTKQPRRRFARARRFMKRFPVYFTRYYQIQIRFLVRHRVIAIIAIILLFGLPVFMLPEKIELDEAKRETMSPWQLSLAEKYNTIVAKETYKEKIKPIIEKSLGGTLRLFVQKVYNGSYFTRSEEVVLSITASMPNGTTLDQMNHLVKQMESYLSTHKEIRQFQTNINSPRQARIQVYFTRESERTGFPYTLKSQVISRALELGGGSWSVYGLQDQGFNNDVRESAGSYRIVMYGYNYDELFEWAEKLKANLLGNRRIKEVIINSEFSWYKDDYQEFSFNLNKARMAQENILPIQLFASIRPVFGKDIATGSVIVDNETERLKLNSRQSREFDIWNMQYVPQLVNGKYYKLAELAEVEKGQMPQQVAKVNQQYRLCLQYEYIGASNQGTRIQERTLKEFNADLPMGYTAEREGYSYSWGKKDNKQYLLLLLIIVIIFFTTSILFNSFKQPLAVIFVIPISYIGVFLTFYWFKLNFDQGGFASFVLLCGITVNASIYIINEYNQLRERHPQMSSLRLYLKAWNAKVTPIFLTVVSTVLGFIPFMVGSTKEAFWFPLAAGTIGGLIMSVIAIFFFLPIFSLNKKVAGVKVKKKRGKGVRRKESKN